MRCSLYLMHDVYVEIEGAWNMKSCTFCLLEGGKFAGNQGETIVLYTDSCDIDQKFHMLLTAVTAQFGGASVSSLFCAEVSMKGSCNTPDASATALHVYHFQ